jgi:dolichol-phosphate mannosyltransferase
MLTEGLQMKLIPTLSIVSPAYNETGNLPLLYRRLVKALSPLGLAWEWIVVDDHSSDETFAAIQALASDDSRVRGVRLARNSGSHAAIRCGLAQARGQAAMVLAADLQDPPELAPDLVARWREGAQVVWAARAASLGAGSRLYHLLLGRISHSPSPAYGADVVLLDRVVLDALAQFGERHNSLFALIAWMGFRQETLRYRKQPRHSGRSGWTLGKKIALLLDSVTAFTYAPIRWLSWVGFSIALAGFAYAAIVVGNAFTGRPPSGWSSLVIVVLVIGGLQMLMMGVLGEYLWRALSESRRRPAFLIEETTRAEAALKRKAQ